MKALVVCLSVGALAVVGFTGTAAADPESSGTPLTAIQRCESGEEALEYTLGYGGYTVPDEVGRRVLAAASRIDVREFAVVRRFRAR
jgi:hypothetical protein